MFLGIWKLRNRTPSWIGVSCEVPSFQGGVLLLNNNFARMKKAFAVVMGAMLLSVPFISLADTTPPVLGAADPNLATMQWNLTGYQTPNVAAGTIVTDQHGYSEPCPSWYPKAALGACQVITGTDFYQSRMNDLAKQLITIFGSKANAMAKAPMFAGWISIQ